MTPRTPVCVICVKGNVSDTTLKGVQRELNQSVNTRNKVARHRPSDRYDSVYRHIRAHSSLIKEVESLPFTQHSPS